MNTKRASRYAALFVLLLIVGGLIALRLAPAGGVKRHLQKIHAAGLPASAAELNVWYKSVPPTENRAQVLVEAAKQLVTTPGEFETKWTNETSPAYVSAVTKYLETNKQVLAELYRVPELSGSRFPVDFSPGFGTLLPHLAQVKSLVLLLKLDTARHVREHNPDAACRSLESAFATANAIRVEPLLISQLVGVACESITLNSLTNVLNSLQLTDAQLARLNTTIAQLDLDVRDGLFRGLVGERAIGLDAFNAHYTFQQLQALGSGGPGSGPAAWVQALGYQAYILSGLWEHDFECYLEMMASFVDATRADFPEALARNEQTSAALQARFSTGLGRLAILSRMLLPSLEKAMNKQAMISARLRCAELGLAIERYRLAHGGALPGTTEDLVPNYLLKLPRNPFTGEALAYQRLPEKGYEILSGGGPIVSKSTTPIERAAFGTNRANRTERAAFTVLR